MSEPWSIAAARDLACRASVDAVVDEFLDRNDAVRHPNVWTALVPEEALRTRAAALDATETRGPLHGVPVAVKDNIDVAGIPTTAGARAFAYTPGRDASITRALVDAGAIVVGKTNLDQFATGLTGTRAPDFGVCPNPVDVAYIAGGSSSGSAVTVATGIVPLAIGTDTAGSGRVPAACCGIVGLKPTRAWIDTAGVVPASPQFDTLSLFTNTIGDASAAFAALGGANSRSVPVRVGVARHAEWFDDTDAHRCYEEAVARLGAAQFDVVPVDIEALVDVGRWLYGSALLAERYASFGDWIERHPDATDPAVGELVLGAARFDACEAFTMLRRLAGARTDTRTLWDTVDALMLPTIARHPTVAEALEASVATSMQLGTYTNFVNLLDLAAVAVPATVRTTGLPFGVTFIGPAHSDGALLGAGAAFAGEPLPADNVDRIAVAVVGAHLRGMPLNHQLVELGGRLESTTCTSDRYRLFDLGLTPPKPGLVRDERGAAIEVEVWSLAAEAFGRFVAAVPPPLAIGTVELADGSPVSGFVCEPYVVDDATEITEWGGWRAYQARLHQ